MSSTLYLTSTCAGPAAFTRRNSPNMAPKGMWKVCWITFYPGSIAPFYSKAQPLPGAKHHVSQLFPKPSTASAWGCPGTNRPSWWSCAPRVRPRALLAQCCLLPPHPAKGTPEGRQLWHLSQWLHASFDTKQNQTSRHWPSIFPSRGKQLGQECHDP